MSLIAIIMRGDITHLVPESDREHHQFNDTIYCCCAPTAHMDETDPLLPLIVHHADLAKRKRPLRRFDP